MLIAMRNRQAPPASRRVFVLFVATTLAPALGLSWLGWRMVEQDRALESQRMQERREHAAGLGAEALQRLLAQMEETLASGSSANAAVLEERMRNTRHSDGGAAIVIFGPEGTLDHAGVPLPYHPAVPSPAEPQASVFAAADAVEFQGAGPAAAIPVLRGLADSKDKAVRSAALVRLARNYRKLGDTAPALAALSDLGKLDQTRVNGSPAGLLARQGRALIFEATSRREDLRREADLLDADLHAGRWRLTRAHYEFSKEQVRRWLGSAREDTDRLVLAEAAESVWKQWQSSGRTESEIRERATLRVNGQSVLVLTRGSKDRLTISLIGPRLLESEWLAHLDSLRGPPRIGFALSDSEGQPVLGQPDVPLAMQSVRTAAATRLPWTVHAIDAPGAGAMTSRTRMLLGGIAMMAVLVLGGGYLVHRAISREVAVARLQTDFVAAVSHEFRTPLTTMRQLSEMLVHDRVSTEDRRRQFS